MSLKFTMRAEVNIEKYGRIVEKRGLESGGPVQVFVDSEVLRLCDPYIPFRTGMLRDSGILSTTIGSGEVIYNTPYARRQYYENKGSGKRGKLWFERMKADHRDDILNGAAKIAGGKPVK